LVLRELVLFESSPTKVGVTASAAKMKRFGFVVV
jgi:hypothetical protein